LKNEIFADRYSVSNSFCCTTLTILKGCVFTIFNFVNLNKMFHNMDCSIQSELTGNYNWSTLVDSITCTYIGPVIIFPQTNISVHIRDAKLWQKEKEQKDIPGEFFVSFFTILLSNPEKRERGEQFRIWDIIQSNSRGTVSDWKRRIF
jgi:hypothetical protein